MLLRKKVLDFVTLYIYYIYSIYGYRFHVWVHLIMKVLLSNTSPDPIYEQIKNEVKRQIILGELADGEALPSIRKLALDLQISVITTKRAYDDLEKERLITTVAGKGTFVSAKNRSLLHEKRMNLVESKLAEAVSEAKSLGVDKRDLKQMLSLLLEEE